MNRPKACYTCKRRFREMHQFYDRLCPPCAALNFEKRHLKVDLTGRTILVTGCRVKIGFHVALKLLRNGATVIGTSRFPLDAALRFCAEPDEATWSGEEGGEEGGEEAGREAGREAEGGGGRGKGGGRGRLHLYGLDFRSIPSVEAFCAHVIERHGKLNGIINNACQTVRRPAKYVTLYLSVSQCISVWLSLSQLISVSFVT